MRTFLHPGPILLAALVLLAAPRQAGAADVLLDLPVTAGGFVFFPTREDPTKFRYAPTQARLARHPNGLPQFSFLRFVENVRSAAGEADIREGVGGGIVHAVVALGGTEEELDAAIQELQQKSPGASVVGTVLYESGQFSLVSAFAEESGDFTRRLVGVGAAPVLDGGKAAISMRLSKLGAKVLWESFHSATPDISFLFSMELEGFKTPKQAVLEADFEEIYNHKSFYQNTAQATSMDFGVNIPVDEIVAAVTGGGAGAVLPDIDVGISGHMGTMTQNEIDKAFTELRTAGAIRIEYVGEDEELREIVRDAYDALRDQIFAPAGRIAPKTAPRSVSTRGKTLSPEEIKALQAKRKAAAARKRAEKGKASKAGGKPPTKGDSKVAGSSFELTPEYLAEKKRQEARQDRKDAQGREDALRKEKAEEARRQQAAAKKARDERRARRTPLKPAPPQVDPAKPDCKGVGIRGGDAAGSDKVVSLSMATDFCQVTRFKVRKTRQVGTYRLDMRKYTASTQNIPFAQNISDLRAHLDDPDVFRSVNLDDPLFKQREVAALLNGLDAEDFGEYVNFVTVHLRKQHESGDVTLDEVRIDRKTMNRTGNDFKLLYGWKGDEDRDAWYDYEWRADWSFIGGSSIEGEWRPRRSNAIDLVPPFERRTIRLEGSPEVVDDLDIRMIKVRVHYPVGEEERTVQQTLLVDREDLSRQFEIVVPAGELSYDYEMSWRFRGGFDIETDRLSTTDDTLFVDEIPESAWPDEEELADVDESP